MGAWGAGLPPCAGTAERALRRGMRASAAHRRRFPVRALAAVSRHARRGAAGARAEDDQLRHRDDDPAEERAGDDRTSAERASTDPSQGDRAGRTVRKGATKGAVTSSMKRTKGVSGLAASR